MGNSSQSQSSGSRDQKKRMSTEQIRKIFEQMIQDLQLVKLFEKVLSISFLVLLNELFSVL